MPEPLLATRQEVYDMLESFDALDSDAIGKFFEANGVSSSGVIDYARLMCNGALSMGTPASDGEALLRMLSLFTAGVVLGIKLADKRDEASRRATLHIVRPDPPA